MSPPRATATLLASPWALLSNYTQTELLPIPSTAATQGQVTMVAPLQAGVGLLTGFPVTPQIHPSDDFL